MQVQQQTDIILLHICSISINTYYIIGILGQNAMYNFFGVFWTLCKLVKWFLAQLEPNQCSKILHNNNKKKISIYGL